MKKNIFKKFMKKYITPDAELSNLESIYIRSIPAMNKELYNFELEGFAVKDKDGIKFIIKLKEV